MPRFLPKFLLLALTALACAATPRTSPAQWGIPSAAEITARLEPAEARRGATVELIVKATVDEKYHLYAMRQPTDQPGPIPTSIKLGEEAQGLLEPTGDWQEPDATFKFDRGFEIDVAYLYGSPLEFRREYRIATDAEPSGTSFTVTMNYQACTETSCLPPADAPHTVDFIIQEGEPVAAPPAPEPDDPAAASQNAQSGQQQTRNQAAAANAPGNQDADRDEQKSAGAISRTEQFVAGGSMGGFLITAFALGLLALLTPCVFPMIPITITFFTDKSAKSTASAAGNAGIYVLSIIAGFTIIGFGFSVVLRAMQAGVEASGLANTIAANPWINLFFAALYIVLALSLFGVFQFALPTSVSSKLNMKAMKAGGLVSIFLKAMVFVVISFTCTAPLLGVLIPQAISGAWTRPLFGMMAFATGFAAPFFFLALAPQMIGRLPSAGNWLYATKLVMGLIVLAAAFKFLSNADLILLGESMIFTREVLLAVWTGIAAVIAFYLFGLIHLKEEGENAGSRITSSRMLLATTFGILALYLAHGLFGGQLHSWVEAYMPPDLRPGQGHTTVAGNGASGEEQFDWYEEVEPALAQARSTGQNVFIDFSGYTCTNCRLMEKTMFPRPEVASLMKEYVLVRLYTDDPETGKKWQAYQAKNFGTVTLPLYVIITPDEEVIAKAEYTRDPEDFLSFLRKGLDDRQVAME